MTNAHPIDPQPSLVETLEKQLQAAHDLARILDRECTAIKDRDADALNEIAPIKLDGLTRLEALERVRLEFLQESEGEKNVPEGFERRWQQVIDVVRVCERKNQLNGAMLALRQAHVQRAMDLIADRDSSAVTYSPDGLTQLGSAHNSTSFSV